MSPVEEKKSSVEGVTGPDVKAKLEFDKLREFTVQLTRGVLFVVLDDGSTGEFDLSRVNQFTTSNGDDGFIIKVTRKSEVEPPAPVVTPAPAPTTPPAKK